MSLQENILTDFLEAGGGTHLGLRAKKHYERGEIVNERSLRQE